MTTNAQAREYLDYFLDPGTDSHFAIMLSGPWGSGKTYFIKKYFEERQAAQPRPHTPPAKRRFGLRRVEEDDDPRQGRLYLKVSLFGVRSIDEITTQLFAQAHPFLNSTAANLAGAILTRVSNKYLGSNILSEGELGSAIKKWTLNLEGKAVVFDDFERCSMALVDVMGYINTFVEQDGLKVIVLSDESEIPDGQKEEYRRRKEKLIGKTLAVGSDPSGVFDAFLSALKHERCRAVAVVEKDNIMSTFMARGKANFRTLRAVLTDFDRLVSRVDRRLQESNRAMTELLLYMMATGNENRQGELAGEQFRFLGKSNMRLLRVSAATKSTRSIEGQTTVEKLVSRYPSVNWDDPIVPPATLADLFESGIVDTKTINDHLSIHPLIVGYLSTPAWRLLWEWASIPRKRYDEAVTRLLAELAEKTLTHPGIILHVAGEIISIAQAGQFLVGNDIVDYFRAYIDELLTGGTLEAARDVFGIHAGAYASLGYRSEDTSEFKEIREMLKRATDMAFSKSMQSQAGKLLDQLKTDPATFSKLFERGDGNFGDAAILHFIKVEDFADIAFSDSVLNSRLISSLVARYERDIHERALVVEYEWVRKLRDELEKRVSAETPPFKDIATRLLPYYFGKIAGFVV